MVTLPLFSLHHKPGKLMGKPNALSRRTDHGEGLRSDNEDITLLPPDVFRIHTLTGLTIAGKETSILRDIRRSTREVNLEEPVAITARELQRSPSRRSVRSAEWALKDHLLLFRGKIYIPKDKDLQLQIIKQHHDSRIAGHPGQFKTLKLILWSY